MANADEDVARLVSLLEGAVSPARAREALAAAGGSVEGAIRTLFSTSTSDFAMSASAVVELDDSQSSAAGSDSELPGQPERGHKRRRPARQRPSRAQSTVQPERPSAAAAKRRRHPAGDQAALPDQQADSSSSPVVVAPPPLPAVAPPPAVAPSPAVVPPPTSVGSPPVRRRVAASAGIRPQPRVVAPAATPSARAGWESVPVNTWTSFPTGNLQQLLENNVSGQDPPCLTLRGHNAEEVPSESNGKVHAALAEEAAAEGDNEAKARPHFSDAYVLKGTQWEEDGRISVKSSLLRDLFADLVGEVRYPPTSLEVSYRVISSRPGQRCKEAPDDLLGPLPARPFELLNNNDDVKAPQPPSFEEHRLRPEQLRSLSWMLACEGHSLDAGVSSGSAGGGSGIVGGSSSSSITGDSSSSSSSSSAAGGSTSGSSGGSAGAVEPFMVEWRRYWTIGFHDSAGGHSEALVEGARVRLRSDATLPQNWNAAQPAGKTTAAAAFAFAVMSQGGGVFRQVWDSLPRTALVEFGKLCLVCRWEDLEFVDNGGLEIGCQVRVAPWVISPAYGWGGVSPKDVGVLLRVEGDFVVVRFTSHATWKGRKGEVQRADAGSRQGAPERPFVLDLRVQAFYPVRGGILADRVGYGKTATMIGLMDATMRAPIPEVPSADRDGFIPAKGTLIIVPSNLYEQWLTEISKFVWGGKPLKGAMHRGWSSTDCPWKIFAMTNVTPLTRVTAGELAQADVVLCSYRLLYSVVYQERRKQVCQGTSLAELVMIMRSFLAGAEPIRSGRKGEKYAHSWEELEFPVLEMFHWRRVVFDEFHELESFDSLQQNSLQHMRASYRWGLTGTPPVDGSAGTVFMSSLFRVDLPGTLQRPPESMGYPDLAPWEGDRLLAEMSGRFLDRYVRQNTAVLPHVRLEEHVVVVQHSAAERALYLAQAHDAPPMDSEGGMTAANVQELERLLKLCSHFQAVGDNVSSAKEECERIGEQKERRVVRARNQLKRCAFVMELLKARLPKKSKRAAPGGAWCKELTAAEEKLPAEGDSGKQAVEEFARASREAASAASVLWTDVLEHHKPRDAELSALLGPMDSKKGYAHQWARLASSDMEPDQVVKLLTGQAKEQAQNLREFLDATVSLGFFRRTMETLAKDQTPENRSCTVCLEEGLQLTHLAITPCAHMFCLDCLKMTVKKFASCSICRQPLSLKDIRPLETELTAAAHLTSASGSSASSSSSSSDPPEALALAGSAGEPEGMRFDKYGTKLAALVRKLRELRREDPTAKVILFVQFDDLKRKVAAVLTEFGVPAVQLHGSVSQRSTIIRDWQHNPTSAAFVLLLSLAQSASGTNLTAAGHVVFLHPMLAPTPDRAVGYEMQAIGRARRFGQMRDVVHVWRFVTAGTVEQAMTEKHQSSLWASEQAKSEGAAAA